MVAFMAASEFLAWQAHLFPPLTHPFPRIEVKNRPFGPSFPLARATGSPVMGLVPPMIFSKVR